MIYPIVDDKEPVMRFAEYVYRDGRVLRIMLGDIQGKLLGYFLGKDGRAHSGRTLIQHCEDTLVHIVVNENDSGCCGFDEFTNELVCVEYLTLEEDTLLGFQCFFFQFGENLVKLMIVFKKLVLNMFQALEYRCIRGQETSHCDKSVNNTAANINCFFTMKYC